MRIYTDRLKLFKIWREGEKMSIKAYLTDSEQKRLSYIIEKATIHYLVFAVGVFLGYLWHMAVGG